MKDLTKVSNPSVLIHRTTGTGVIILTISHDRGALNLRLTTKQFKAMQHAICKPEVFDREGVFVQQELNKEPKND